MAGPEHYPTPAGMRRALRNAALLAASCFVLAVAAAATDAADTSGTAPAPGPVERTSKAVERGAKATVSGVKHGTQAVVRGVKRGAHAAAGGIERGARATGRAASKVARKIGIGDKSEGETADAKH